MPGAEKLFSVGGERFNSIDGPQGALTGAVWGSPEALAAVFDYYRLELARPRLDRGRRRRPHD